MSGPTGSLSRNLHMGRGLETSRELALVALLHALKHNRLLARRVARAPDVDRADSLARELYNNLKSLNYPFPGHGAELLDHACELNLAWFRAQGRSSWRARARQIARVLRAAERHLSTDMNALGLTPRAVRSKRGARTHGVSESPGPVSQIPRAAEGLLAIEMRLLPPAHRRRYWEELRSELHDLAGMDTPQTALITYVLRQFRRVWLLRAALQAPDRPRFHRLHRAACWLLASDWRVWGVLGPSIALAIVNVHLQQGWGSALLAIPSVVAFYTGVEWLRKRWNIEVKRRKRPKDPSNIG